MIMMQIPIKRQMMPFSCIYCSVVFKQYLNIHPLFLEQVSYYWVPVQM